MTETRRTPEPKGQVSDAMRGNWVDTLAPEWTRPYLRLSRADRPIGTWLLLIPCVWAVLLSALDRGSLGWDGVWILIACAAGSWLMRGAGCTWNDITDRNFDGQVKRTRSRPIPSGQVTTNQAVAWMILQSLLGLAILLTFNWNAILLGFASLIPVAIYPFAKRFTYWPQAFLGIAFNWGALLAWTAHAGSLGWPAVMLYLTGIFWTLFYDTIYAHQDKEDDASIGVKSTALLFQDATPKWMRRFLIPTVLTMLAAVLLVGIGRSPLSLVLMLAGPWVFGWHLVWQMRKMDIDNPDNLLAVFRSNRDAGLIPVVFFALALFI